MKPRIRSGRSVVHLERGESVIGSLTYGIGQTIADPEGKLLELNEILDGTRTFSEACDEFGARAGLEPDQISDFLGI